MPLFYLFWRFVDLSKNLSRFLNSWDVSTLLINTLFLFFAVVFTSLLLGLSISILTVRYKETWHQDKKVARKLMKEVRESYYKRKNG